MCHIIGEVERTPEAQQKPNPSNSSWKKSAVCYVYSLPSKLCSFAFVQKGLLYEGILEQKSNPTSTRWLKNENPFTWGGALYMSSSQAVWSQLCYEISWEVGKGRGRKESEGENSKLTGETTESEISLTSFPEMYANTLGAKENRHMGMDPWNV